MKLHLACGDVFLTDYVNCDIEGNVVTQEERDVLPFRDLNNYYSNRLVGHKHQTYVDQKFDLRCFPWEFDDESIEEIVMIQAIEHFEHPAAKRIVDEILRILVPGGKLLIDFPDIIGSVLKYQDGQHEFMMRFIYCNHKNPYSVHHWGYTRETFPQLLGIGWEYEFKNIVKHVYPAIGCEATKLP